MIRVEDGPTLRTVKDRRRTWFAATRAVEETEGEKWRETESEIRKCSESTSATATTAAAAAAGSSQQQRPKVSCVNEEDNRDDVTKEVALNNAASTLNLRDSGARVFIAECDPICGDSWVRQAKVGVETCCNWKRVAFWRCQVSSCFYP